MTPLARNIAIAAALVVLPAAAAAAAGPERVRTLPGRIGSRVRDLWEEDDVEGNLRRLAARLDDLTDRLDETFHTRTERHSLLGRLAALAGVAVLVPAAIAALIAPDRARALRDSAGDWWAGDSDTDDEVDPDFDPGAELAGLSDRLEELTGHLDRQRESAFDTVTAAARKGE